MDARFGKYLLHERIGVGGMAEVFRATLPGAGGIDKACVVKRILPSVAEAPEAVKMFLDEARISISLQHGNIVPVLDFGEVDGNYYLAMEYIAGRDLGSVLQRVRKAGLPFPIALAVHVVLEVCRGLAYAHARTAPGGKPLGLVHRDISPTNILVSYEGDVRIVDFGIAKVQEKSVHTDAFTLKGKIPYMSPEQARGGEIDHRTDLYAAGVVLFEMLAGRRPFDGGNQLATLELVRAGGAPRVRTFRADVPEELEAIVATALAADPTARYADGRAMQVALARFLARHDAAVTSHDLATLVQALFPEKVGDHASGARREARPRTDPFERALLGAIGAPPTLTTAAVPELTRSEFEPTLPETPAPVTSFDGIVLSESATPPPGRRWLPTVAIALVGALSGAAVVVWQATGTAPVHLPAAPPPPAPAGQVLESASNHANPGQVTALPAPTRVEVEAATRVEAEAPSDPTRVEVEAPWDPTRVEVGAPSDPTRVGVEVAAGSGATQGGSLPVAPTTGTLVVNAVPWAEVWIDGRRRAESTPTTLRLPLGAHTVRLVNPELGIQKTLAVQVRAGRVSRLVTSLR